MFSFFFRMLHSLTDVTATHKTEHHAFQLSPYGTLSHGLIIGLIIDLIVGLILGLIEDAMRRVTAGPH